nr:OBERON-like protein [Tanacetum cinerariifolium]
MAMFGIKLSEAFRSDKQEGKERVRQVFREWGSKNIYGRVLSFPHRNKGSRAQTLYENECKREMMELHEVYNSYRAVKEYKLFLTTYAEFNMDPTKLQEADKGRLMASREAFNRIANVVQ